MDWAEIVGTYLRDVILPLLGTLLAMAAIAYLRSLAARTEDDRLRAFIEELVRAAEQMFGPKAGEQKLKWVEEQARENGRDAPRSMIEAAVRDLTLLQGVCGNE